MTGLDHLAVWDALWEAGHGDCGGWSHDPATGVTCCACGTVVPARATGRLPVIIVAWKSVGSQLPEGIGRRLAEDWQSIGDLLAYLDGHGDHGGWTFSRQAQVMTCACGRQLYQVTDPVTAEAA